MTMVFKDEVVKNLRKERQKLEDKLKAIEAYLNTFPEKIAKEEGVILYPWFRGLEEILDGEAQESTPTAKREAD